MKLNGQNNISFQLVSPENSMFLLCRKASHTKAMERRCLHHESLSAKNKPTRAQCLQGCHDTQRAETVSGHP